MHWLVESPAATRGVWTIITPVSELKSLRLSRRQSPAPAALFGPGSPPVPNFENSRTNPTATAGEGGP